MTRDDIIKLARECWPSDRRMWSVDADLPRLERFAALVAAAEREACAKVVEASPSYDWHRFACEAAAAIRERSK